LAQGAKVYISSRKADVCEATAQRLSQAYGGQCIALPADLSKLQGVESLAAQLGAHESSLDILINNAGASWGAPLDQFPEVGWDKVMDTNVKGVFFLTQKLLPLLRAAGKGKSLHGSSISGRLTGSRARRLTRFLTAPRKLRYTT